jgi:hypothetical protein
MPLTSGFHAVIQLLLYMPWSQAWGFRYHWDTPVRARTRPARRRLGGSVAHELFYRLGRFAGIFVLPDPDGQLARSGELGIGVAVATGDAPRNFRRHQLVLVLGRWLCSGQECQKHPSTNTAIRAPRKSMSTACGRGCRHFERSSVQFSTS